uniref:Uncharacterized protein n=1 Tax=Trichuris muris TaxID=70415 RepID=A0A5S6QJ65_TRIMR
MNQEAVSRMARLMDRQGWFQGFVSSDMRAFYKVIVRDDFVTMMSLKPCALDELPRRAKVVYGQGVGLFPIPFTHVAVPPVWESYESLRFRRLSKMAVFRRHRMDLDGPQGPHTIYMVARLSVSLVLPAGVPLVDRVVMPRGHLEEPHRPGQSKNSKKAKVKNERHGRRESSAGGEEAPDRSSKSITASVSAISLGDSEDSEYDDFSAASLVEDASIGVSPVVIQRTREDESQSKGTSAIEKSCSDYSEDETTAAKPAADCRQR